uniref:Uncharacterized protein n=1 Tax=Rhizophora mucronata TaxID=61149 RepID=A0A2P2QBE8_RHIMU
MFPGNVTTLLLCAFFAIKCEFLLQMFFQITEIAVIFLLS